MCAAAQNGQRCLYHCVAVSASSLRPGREPTFEDRVDVRRYLDALGRSRWLIVTIVGTATVVALAVSLALPKTYVATARIVLEEQVTGVGQSDPESVQRRLATINQLLTTPRVLREAARGVPGQQPDSIAAAITSGVDPEANILSVDASDGDPKVAARIANAVSANFVKVRARGLKAQISKAISGLEQKISQLEGTPNADVQIRTIRESISLLTVSERTAGSDLSIAEEARPPSEASSPRPTRNSVLAFFAALFLAVLIALGRDQLVPRVSGPRELGRLLDLPVLAGVPYVRGRFRRRQVMSGVEAEAFQTLRANLELALAGRRKHLILMTGAMHAEGKTTATARLGRALAQAGRRVLLVSADLRVPKLHEMFNVPTGIGVCDLLAVLDWEAASLDDELLEGAIHVVMAATPGKEGRGELHLITSGTKAKDPGRLMSGEAVEHFLGRLNELDYDYVLVDGPPLLGIADSQVMARHVHDILIVSKLDRITLDHVADLRDVLDRLPTKPVGLVVLGAKGEMSPYYLARRPLIQEEEASP